MVTVVGERRFEYLGERGSSRLVTRFEREREGGEGEEWEGSA